MVRCLASASARLTAADPLTALLPAPCPPRRLLPMLLAGRRRRSAVVGLAELAQVEERERLPVEALPSQIRPCPATSRLTSAALRDPAVLALALPPLEALSPRLPAAAECGRVGLPFTATATVFGFRSTSAPADSGRACRSSAIDAE